MAPVTVENKYKWKIYYHVLAKLLTVWLLY